MTSGEADRAGFSFAPATLEERTLLQNMAQFYYYDFSEVLDMHLDPNGRFGDIDLSSYWADEWRHPFLLKVDGRAAGFALIAERSKITGESGVFDMTEFFVLRRFRRRGIGREAAFAAFNRFAGRWEVRQREENPKATAFWRAVIRAYTGGEYAETRWTRPHWSEVVQTFATTPAKVSSPSQTAG